MKGWGDYSVPESTETLLALIGKVKEIRCQRQKSWNGFILLNHFLFLSGRSTAPILVHCSAGVGRFIFRHHHCSSKNSGGRDILSIEKTHGFCTVTTLFNGIFQDWYLHSYPEIDGYNRTASDIWVIFFLFLCLWQRFEGNWVVVLDFHMEGVVCHVIVHLLL